MARVALMLAQAACAPPPAERLHDPRRIPHAVPADADYEHARRVRAAIPPLVPRPDVPVDVAAWVPDATEELRWPLTGMTHPVLEPTYPIAPVFAMPGVAWTDLCARGAQNRTLPGAERDHVEYLRAWCAVGARDIDRAVDMLGKLRASVVPRLAEAVRHDIANIVADGGSADEAQKLLARAAIDDPALDDIVSATFAEVGSLADAATFNQMALASHASPDLVCHRLAKRIVIDPDATAPFAELEKRGTKSTRGAPDPTCERLFALLACSLRHHCAAHFATTGADPRRAHFLEAFDAFSRSDMPAEEWLRVAHEAIDAMPIDGADHLAAAAIANGTRAIFVCSDTIDGLREAAWAVINGPHDAAIDLQLRPDLVRLDRLCPSAKP